MTLPVAVLVITRNEERHIGACLASVAWAEEKLVVDSGSTDATVRLAEEAGARVLTRPFDTHALQKNWGLEQIEHQWVLCLDADERAGEGMERDVARALEEDRAAWRARRVNWFLDGFVRHGSWGRDRVVRLIDRRRCRFEEKLIHERVEVDGEVGNLRAPILHYTCEDMEEFMRRADTYARLGAQEAAERGARASATRLFVRPLSRFLRSWVLLWGFLDGRRGLLQAWMAAWGAWLKYAYLYELEAKQRLEGAEEERE